ncbi:Zinc Protease [Paramagnetospirillum magnetotacticum MS-1]|uniref:Zinc Protease n=1 Tax=Paramagnetospirillum magnetotacticum MS-1 TaxID=272627 RepID=A0A0C2U6K5_PARME|nr:pitrilysin family protein [Paramagnetospirillum magnetotacticum]KIL97082.1 Zinc Protease [Paramagnetospirillum magnetotacticum MS-1]
MSPIRMCMLVLGMLLAALPVRAAVFDPVTFTLSNGMQVVVISNHRVPIVNHMVWYKVGAGDEEPGRSGLAHLLEHLMFKGTPSTPPGEFSKIVARNGGRDNAFTSSDYTGYYQDVAADKLELVMRLEADRMRNLVLDEANFRTERDVVLEERRSRTDNNPAALLNEQMEAALYLNSPYHRPIIGWPDEIAALSLDDALAFYRRWYAPNNAILVVAGDVTAEQVRPLAEKYYGVLARAETPARARTEEPPHRAERRVVLKDGRVAQPSWSRLYLAPSLGAGARDLAYPLEVLADLVGEGTTSRLYRTLVVDKGAAAAISADYDPIAVGQTSFRVSAMPRPGVPLEKLEALIEQELARIVKDGFSAEEVERAKSRLRASAAYGRDSLHTGAQTLGQALASGISVDEVEAWPDRITAVTPEQVARAAATVFKPTSSVTGLLLPDLAAAKPGQGRAVMALPDRSTKGVH